MAARKIAWGKFLNAGQTCISIDYVFIHESVKKAFITELKKEINKRYANAAFNDSYPKIVNRRHYNRLKKLISTETKIIGGDIMISNEKSHLLFYLKPILTACHAGRNIRTFAADNQL